ncbi:MAG: peptidylprolyl isomerase [Chloroflexota bacterium]|nr:peptidylprolyl isomerase [Chloroflexota bacterium]
MTIDSSKQYSVVIKTDKGDIRLQLFADQAPRAVNNFVFLAKDGFYDGLTFYSVLPGFVAQAGDPTCTESVEVTCTRSGGPGYFLPREGNDLQHDAGVVAMAAPPGGEDINGSQFYVTYTPQLHLDGRDTVFGKVVEGTDVLESLTSRDARDPSAPPGDKILSVSIEELGGAPPPTTE